MGRYLKTATSRAGAAGISGLWKRVAGLLHRRRFAGIDRLNEHMLRDIGLGDARRSELGKIERLRRPQPDHMIGVVLDLIARERMGEDGEAAAVGNQPLHHV